MTISKAIPMSLDELEAFEAHMHAEMTQPDPLEYRVHRVLLAECKRPLKNAYVMDDFGNAYDLGFAGCMQLKHYLGDDRGDPIH